VDGEFFESNLAVGIFEIFGGLFRELQLFSKLRQLGVKQLEGLVIGLFIAFVVPAGLASLWGDFWGGLLVAGAFRTLLLLHATWCVNSVAHWFGTQPYSKRGSARNSILTALITGGEGYHNFHHQFPSDYRNGIRWYQYDPTKWFIWALSKVGLAHGLSRTPDSLLVPAEGN